MVSFSELPCVLITKICKNIFLSENHIFSLKYLKLLVRDIFAQVAQGQVDQYTLRHLVFVLSFQSDEIVLRFFERMIKPPQSTASDLSAVMTEMNVHVVLHDFYSILSTRFFKRRADLLSKLIPIDLFYVNPHLINVRFLSLEEFPKFFRRIDLDNPACLNFLRDIIYDLDLSRGRDMQLEWDTHPIKCSIMFQILQETGNTDMFLESFKEMNRGGPKTINAFLHISPKEVWPKLINLYFRVKTPTELSFSFLSPLLREIIDFLNCECREVDTNIINLLVLLIEECHTKKSFDDFMGQNTSIDDLINQNIDDIIELVIRLSKDPEDSGYTQNSYVIQSHVNWFKNILIHNQQNTSSLSFQKLILLITSILPLRIHNHDLSYIDDSDQSCGCYPPGYSQIKFNLNCQTLSVHYFSDQLSPSEIRYIHDILKIIKNRGESMTFFELFSSDKSFFILYCCIFSNKEIFSELGSPFLIQLHEILFGKIKSSIFEKFEKGSYLEGEDLFFKDFNEYQCTGLPFFGKNWIGILRHVIEGYYNYLKFSSKIPSTRFLKLVAKMITSCNMTYNKDSVLFKVIGWLGWMICQTSNKKLHCIYETLLQKALNHCIVPSRACQGSYVPSHATIFSKQIMEMIGVEKFSHILVIMTAESDEKFQKNHSRRHWSSDSWYEN